MEFLKFLPENSLAGKVVAAFDTRISTDDIGSTFLQFLVNLGGYAARPIAKWLQKKGALAPVPAEGFFVDAKEGPLKAGELERATEWAKSLIN
jgi:flavodoxin